MKANPRRTFQSQSVSFSASLFSLTNLFFQKMANTLLHCNALIHLHVLFKVMDGSLRKKGKCYTSLVFKLLHCNALIHLHVLFKVMDGSLRKKREMLYKPRIHLLSSPEPLAQDELIGWDSSQRPSVYTFRHEYL